MVPARFAQLLLLLASLILLPTTAVRAQPAPAPTAVPGTVVGAAAINIRTCPRLDCDVSGSARLGDRLLVTGAAADGFVPVERGGMTGYASALYVFTAEGGTPELRQGLPGCNRVALIFNVGVDHPPRLEILDRLEADGVPATVFPMGFWAEKHPDLLRRIADAGFPIGSHGDQRGNLTERGDVEVLADVRSATAKIERVLGRPPEPYFTPFAADTDERVRSLVARAGYLPVIHGVPADDWNYDADPDAVWENVVPKVTDGAIVEFHLDAPASAESTGVALPWIVDALRAKGFRFVTIPEMARPCA